MSEVIQLGNCMANGKRENPNQGRVYDKEGLAPCLTSMEGGNLQPMVIESTPILISRDDGSGHLVNNPSVEKVNQNCANSLRTNEPELGNHHSNMVIVRMIGRNPDNPSDRTPGIELEQRLEPNSEGICNTLTTVQKDNLVLEETIKIKQATKKGYAECKIGGVADFSFPDRKTRRGRVEQNGDVSPTLMAGNSEIVKIEKVGQISNEGSQCGTVVSTEGLYPTISAGCHGYANPHILEKNGFYEQAIKTAEANNAQEGDIIDAFNQKVLTDGISPTITTRPEGKKTAILPVVERYRIRKLTPRECFRLMNVEEEQFNRAEKVVSNSQLYKVAGNAIVVSVLCALFSQLGIQGKKKWNDMTEDERIALVHKNTVMEGK